MQHLHDLTSVLLFVKVFISLGMFLCTLYKPREFKSLANGVKIKIINLFLLYQWVCQSGIFGILLGSYQVPKNNLDVHTYQSMKIFNPKVPGSNTSIDN